MNRKRLTEEAEGFQGEGDCYIHVEMKGGKNCEVLLAGDGLAVLHGLCGAVQRLGEIKGGAFETTLNAMRAMHEATQTGGGTSCGS